MKVFFSVYINTLLITSSIHKHFNKPRWNSFKNIKDYCLFPTLSHSFPDFCGSVSVITEYNQSVRDFTAFENVNINLLSARVFLISTGACPVGKY